MTLAAAVSSSCADDPGSVADDLRAALRRTDRLASAVTYTERTDDAEVSVVGVIEDDYRYRARVWADDTPVFEEIARDDALAVRFLDPAAATRLVLGEAAPSGEAGGPAAQLLAGRWVLDDEGAPDVTGGVDADRPVGEDVVLDALTALRYVDRAIGEAAGVVVFNEESVDYRADEDPFPKPKKDSGVVRYDFRPPRVPSRNQAQFGSQSVPGPGHFRRMAVYVEKGLVRQVLEQVSFLFEIKDLQSRFGLELPKGAEADAAQEAAAEAVNALHATQGTPQVRPRTMSLELLDLGDDQNVALPIDVVRAPLSLIAGRGRQVSEATGATGATSSTTTSTQPPG